MQFEVGETIDYPHRDAAMITEVKAHEVKTLTLKTHEVRTHTVGDPLTGESTTWPGRGTVNREKVSGGDVSDESGVVRDVWRRDQDHALSAGEESMLAQARQILVPELALAEKPDEAKDSTALDEVLAS